MNQEILKELGIINEKWRGGRKSVNSLIIRKTTDDAEDQRLFYAVVLEPMTDVTPEGDTHGHVMKAEEIEKSAHYFMEMGSTVFQSHKSKIDAAVVESYIAPVNFIPEGSEVEIIKGSWVMTVKVFDEDMWADIKSGEITAFSPGGYGNIVDI